MSHLLSGPMPDSSISLSWGSKTWNIPGGRDGAEQAAWGPGTQGLGLEKPSAGPVPIAGLRPPTRLLLPWPQPRDLRDCGV